MIKSKIKSVKSVGFKTVCDITVDKDKSYISKGGLINHNTTSGDIKKMFVPPPGYILVEVDYSQAELRVVAELAQDKAMIDIFQRNYNIHMATACKINGGIQLYDVAKSAEKDENHKDHLFWVKQKKRAKTINFGILYGQTEKKLSIELECTEAEAKKFITDWYAAYPQVAKWIKAQKAFAHKHGYVKSLFGRKRRLYNIYSDKFGVMLESERQCVDEKTQALTKQGWKGYAQLKVGEEILTKNPQTGLLEWQPIKGLNSYTHTGDMYRTKNNSFDALTTEEHKWLVNKSTHNKTPVFKTTQELSQIHKPMPIHRSGKYKGPEKVLNLSLDYLKLLGIILTDGSLRKYSDKTKPRYGQVWNAVICQAKFKNIPLIDSLIQKLGLAHSRKLRFGHTVYWRFPKQVAEEFNQYIPDKQLTFSFILSLSPEQLLALRDGMLLGDGVRRGKAILTGKKTQADVIQVLNILCGGYSNINTRDNRGRKCHSNKIPNKKGYVEIKHKSYQVSLGKRSYFHHYNNSKGNLISKIKVENQLVWCPTVDNSTWVCRRNGKQYITGNSVNTPIQGTASDFGLLSQIVIREMRMAGEIDFDIQQSHTVHDSIGYYVKPEHVHKLVPILTRICDNPNTLDYFGFQMTQVKMKVSVEVCFPSWFDKKEYSAWDNYVKMVNPTKP